MRPFPLTVLKGGINRLRVKGGASASQLYDLQNGYITNDGSIAPREGTIRSATLDTRTVGLMANSGVFNIFSNVFSTSTATVPPGYQLNVLVDPVNSTASPTIIWFAKPFMGFPYVVAQFSDGLIFHYWLQNNGVWTSNTVYTSASIVLPTPQNGLAYQGVRDFPPNPTWTAQTNISLGNFVEPTEATGFAYGAVAIAGYTNGVLFHFDGAAGSTNFPDSSGNSLVATAHGAAKVETTNVQFGSGALDTTGAGSYVSVPITANGPLDLGFGDFTIEGWMNAGVQGGGQGVLFSLGTTGGGSTPIYVYFNSSTTKLNGAIFTNVVSSPSSVTLNTWHHFALVVKGTISTLFLDGIAGATGGVAGRSSIGGATWLLLLADQLPAGVTPYTGLIDEFRITKGTALYTANFTPPTAPFASALPAHTGSTEPVWPTIAGATLQEFGDFGVSTTDAGTTQGTTAVPSQALGSNITDRYGNSSTIANGGTPAAIGLTLPTVANTNVTTWAPGTLYAPGAVVQPTTTQGAFINAIPNGDFENGNDGNWTFSGTPAWTFSNTGMYQGNTCITIAGGSISAGGALATMTNFGVVTPGQSVTASAYLNPNNVGANLTMWVQLNWYDANDVFLSATGNQQNEQEGGGYRQLSVTGTAPPNAVHCRVAVGAGSGTSSRNAGFADLVSWNLEQPATISNFLFEAIQPNPASSGQTQPIWPTSAGATIIDNGVTWKAVGTSIITWEAIPLMQSGATQPAFPTTVGLSVIDTSSFTDVNGAIVNTSMSWEAISRQITDPKNPNTNAVALGASHVFAADNDLVDFSAAVDPTDWHTTNNAGYLPTGLNNYGDNPVAMLALYRSNLMVFNAGGYQMWQIDPDPANMALLDAQPVGSIYPRAAQSVANDLLFLTEVGVRNLGTIGATANMQIGNTGQPIDPLVIAQLQGGNTATVFAVTCGAVTTTTGFGNFQVAGLPNGGFGYITSGLPTTGFGSITTGGSITPANFGSIPVAGIAGNNGSGTINNTDLYLYFQGNIPATALLSINGIDIAGNPYMALGVNAQVSTSNGYTQFFWANATTDFPFPTSGTVEVVLTAPGSGSPTFQPISLYYPGRGQYWLIFGPQAFVLTINGAGTRSWSRYIFPDVITDWTLNLGVLYLRSKGNLVWRFDANTLYDDFGGNNNVFNGVIQWPYLDMGSLGLNKMMVGVDLVGEGDVILQVGFDQADKSTFNDNANFSSSTNVTAPYRILIADTVPGEPLPFPINAPSYSVILTFPGGQNWSWEAANIYLSDGRGAGATG